MDYHAMPKIKIEIEDMKHLIINRVLTEHEELGKELEKEIERAIQSYDWQGKVTEIVHSSLTRNIQSYFEFGEGSRLVKSAVEEGFTAVLNVANDIHKEKDPV